MQSKPVRRAVLVWVALFLFAFFLRLGYLFNLAKVMPFFDAPMKDSLVYLTKGIDLTKTNWLGSGVFFHSSPAYFYFLGLLWSLFPQDQFFYGVRVVQSLVGSATCVVVGLLAARVFERRHGIAAGAIAACYGPFVYFDGELLEIWFVLFLVGCALLLHRIWEESLSRPALAGTGLCFGLAALGRPNILLCLGALVLYHLICHRGERGRIGAILTLLVPAALAIAPVTIRNYLVGGDLVLVSSNGGINFFLGNNSYANGAFRLPPELKGANLEWYDAKGRNVPLGFEEMIHEATEDIVGRRLRPSEVSRYWFHRGLAYWKESPGLAGALTLYKIHLLFNAYEIPIQSNYYLFREMLPTLRAAFFNYWLVLPLAGMGLFLARFRRKDLGYLPWFLAVYALSLVPFFITDRYRLPLVPVLIVLAAFAVVEGCCWLVAAQSRIPRLEIAGGMLVAILLLFLTLLPSRLSETELLASAHNTVGISLAVKHRYDEAQLAFMKALELSPGNTHYRNNLEKLRRDRAEARR